MLAFNAIMRKSSNSVISSPFPDSNQLDQHIYLINYHSSLPSMLMVFTIWPPTPDNDPQN